MEYLGIGFVPVFWGFMAMFAEFFGGLCVMLGFRIRIAAILMIFTMFVAGVSNLGKDRGWLSTVDIFQLISALVLLVVTGAGKYSVQRKPNQAPE